MGRILAIDYGQKRVGIAATDELQLIANAITTVRSADIWNFIEKYMNENIVDMIVVGEAKNLSNEPSDSSRFIEPFVNKLAKKYPAMRIERFDERFTSKMAFDAMIEGGLGKKKRQDKALIDRLSATILLQSFLDSYKKRNTL